VTDLFDSGPVLAGLKDFQLKTVRHVERQFFEREQRRFLVADEVGLGKTLVARGLVARIIERLQAEGVARIDVVYICSNQEIARQNLRRLNVLGRDDLALPSRLTLLPRHVGSMPTDCDPTRRWRTAQGSTAEIKPLHSTSCGC